MQKTDQGALVEKAGYADHTQGMRGHIDEWYGWYTAVNSFYDYDPRPDDSEDSEARFKVRRVSVHPARMVCQDWASLVLDEKTVVSVPDAAQEPMDAWLDSTRFMDRMSSNVEAAFGTGTGGVALRIEGVTVSEDGSVVADSRHPARFVPQFFDARHIYPLTFTEHECSECAFVSQTTMGGKPVDQVQAFVLAEGGAYAIQTTLLDKGRVVARAETRTGSKVAPFAIYTPGLTNIYADWSVMGMAVFADALGAVRLVDEAFDNMHRDIYLGQKMVFVSESLLRRDSAGKRYVVPREVDQQVFCVLDSDGMGNDLVHEYNPSLRVEENKLAYETALAALAARCGLGSDYYRSESGGVKTATEVISDRSDLYRNLQRHKRSVAPAIVGISRAVLALSDSCNGTTWGDTDGLVDVVFDDSVLTDTQTTKADMRSDVAAGLLSEQAYHDEFYPDDTDWTAPYFPTEE